MQYNAMQCNTYNNSLRGLVGLPKQNKAYKIFVDLGIQNIIICSFVQEIYLQLHGKIFTSCKFIFAEYNFGILSFLLKSVLSVMLHNTIDMSTIFYSINGILFT